MAWSGSRRRFLQYSGASALGAVVGCGDDAQRAASEPDAAADVDAPDMAPAVEPDQSAPDASSQAPLELTKPPFVQIVGASARLRFESVESRPLAVRLEPEQGMGLERLTAVNPYDRPYSWPTFELNGVDHVDEEGRYYTQSVSFEGLEPGRRYRWYLDLGGGDQREGVFRMTPPPEADWRMVWISDTMHPNSPPVIALAAEQQPDFVLHGGDVQYFTTPFDTWNGFFHNFEALSALAPLHVTVGNHEYESRDPDEFGNQFERLFSGQGEGQAADYFAMTLGRLRLLVLNSERGLRDPDSAQHRWMLAELEAAQRNPMWRTIVAFHRPIITFGRVPDRSGRDLLHPIFRDHGVSVVFAGHDHCYQRFEIEGVHYIVDGGGGAPSLNPDSDLFRVERDSPADLQLRLAAEREYGITRVDAKADGSLEIVRLDIRGNQNDALTLV